jgi:hypothetical protein
MKIKGLEVRDARKPIHVHISKADTVTGRQRDPSNCAAAKAFKREPGVKEARVYRSRTYLRKTDSAGQDYWERTGTPNSVRAEIIAMDKGGKFEPGDYVFPPLPKAAQLGGRPGRVDRGPHVKKSTVRSYHFTQGIREIGPRGSRKKGRSR